MSPARRKPASIKQSCKPRCPASDSDSDSDNDYGGDNDKVSLERYRALQLAWACATWEHNVRAIRELRALFEGVYTKRADKAVQGAMLEDLMVALAQAERMGRLDGALDGLVTAALRVLPKQKRNAVATAHRRAAVQQRREARRRHSPDGTPRAESDDNSSEGGDGSEGGGVRLPSLHDLPLEVTETVFEHLGPVELGRCACVSRSWREVAVSSHMDMVWRQLFHLTFPRSALVAAAGPEGVGAPLATAYTVFCRAALGKPRRLARWSGRVLQAGTLRWVCTDDLRRLPACAFRELGFPTESQVVQWACGKRNVGASSSSSGESSDDDDGSDSDYEPSSSAAGERLARMKLWALPAVP